MTTLTFGCSLHLISGRWQVWHHDEEQNTILPLAAYHDHESAKAAAFELAHSAVRGDSPVVSGSILANRDGDGVPFTEQEASMLRNLIFDTLQHGGPAQVGTTPVFIRTTDYDHVFVVRYNRPA